MEVAVVVVVGTENLSPVCLLNYLTLVEDIVFSYITYVSFVYILD